MGGWADGRMGLSLGSCGGSLAEISGKEKLKIPRCESKSSCSSSVIVEP